MKNFKIIILSLLSLNLSGCFFDISMPLVGLNEETSLTRLTGSENVLFKALYDIKKSGSTATKIEKLDLTSGIQQVIVGTSTAGTSDGTGTSATFTRIRAMLLSSDSNYLWVADNCALRKVDLSTLIVSTVAGTVNTCGEVNGFGTSIRFNPIYGLAEKDGFIYLATSAIIKKYNINTTESTDFVGTTLGDIDGIGTAAKIMPKAMIKFGNNLYIADINQKIKKINLDTAQVSTIAGAGVSESVDGIGLSAKIDFTDPLTSFTTDNLNVLFWTEKDKIRKMNLSTLEVETLLSTDLLQDKDGDLSQSKMFRPSGIFFNTKGLFISNQYNIRRLF